MFSLIIIAGIVLIIIGTFARSERKAKAQPESGSNRKPEGLIQVDSATEDSTTTLTIKLNEEELKRQISTGELHTAQRMHAQPEDIAGFYGQTRTSPNGIYTVVYADSYEDNGRMKNGQLALVKERNLLFRKTLQRPAEANASDTGIVVCCDYTHSQELTGKFIVFDSMGEVLFSKKPTAIPGNCAVSADGTTALFETHSSDTDDSDQVFIIDIPSGQIVGQFERPFTFNSAVILPDQQRVRFINHKNFVYETDYTGEQQNVEAYEKQILLRGSVCDKMVFYESRGRDEKYHDPYYVELLEFALGDEEACYSFGKDRIYRKIGEYYEAIGASDKAIENWEEAIAINPKVGIAQKLERLKKRSAAKDQ